ncbi:response regulator [Luteimonas sp. SJ-16]|uniref:histidine kinase n=2 Tax=Luteimonas deserti TaxID=2752306 RepID=A0A7Z0QPN2_9GAMM|nr:response regulator [Luteimonas deserti]
MALVGVWCLLWACTALARDDGAITASRPQPRQLGVLDGLPSNRVNALAEDRQGFLWVATRDGLARYDGVGFRVWRVEDGLRDNMVWSVHVDRHDRVWAGTRNGGLSMLDAGRRTFTHYDRTSHPEMGEHDIWAVTSTPDGAIWFGTAGGGLFRLAPDGALRRFTSDPGDPRSLPSDIVAYLVVDGDDTLWVAGKAGVAAWTGDGFRPLALPLAPGELVEGLVADADGDLWIGARMASFVRRAGGDPERMSWVDPVLGQPVLHMLVKDRQGTRWLDTSSGLAREIDGRIEDVPLFSVTSRGLVRPMWTAGLEDREGGLWFGTVDAGLWYLPATWRNFTTLQRRMADPASMANALVNGVAPTADGALWLVGSGGGLDRLDPRTGAIEHRASRICDSEIARAVHETATGQVLVACTKRLLRFDPVTRRRQVWGTSDGADVTLELTVQNIIEQDDGTLWISFHDGVQARRPDGTVILSVLPGSPRGGLPASARPTRVMRGFGDTVWLATTDGLYRWDGSRATFALLPGSPRREIAALALQDDDTVWLASLGSIEAHTWDGTRLRLRRAFDVDDGMPLALPGDVKLDARGAVWVTTVRGLLRIDPETPRIRTYGVRDGLLSQEFSEHPMGVSREGHLAVGTTDGLLLFHPLHVRQREKTPPLVIETLHVRRGDDVVELDAAQPIRLQHGDRDLSVVARLLSFTDAHAHHYRFRLDGYETGWVELDTTAERVFPRLPSGRYGLHIEARTEDGDWVALAPLTVQQAPPWWRTGWALLILLLCFGFGIWRIAHAYRERLKRRHAWQLAEEKRELAEQASTAKTRFLATLGHEVRTPMTGVLGMSELLLDTALDARQRDYTLAIRRAGEHLMRLVNDALDLARIEAGKLQLETQPFDLALLVRDISGLGAPLARQKGLDFEVLVAPDAPAWVVGDATRVRQILLNLIGNALKFTDTGGVVVQVETDRSGLTFRVRDTGPGLSADQMARLFRRFEQAEGARTNARYGGSGLGLAISQELSAAMGGRIDVESTPGEGTTFRVQLPLPCIEAPTAAPVMPGHERITAAVGLEILLVEDDQTVADVISGLLQGQGHEVVHVKHGLAALTEVTARGFDIALLDLDLPGVDGLTLAGMLRAVGFERPLVAVTARADPEAEPAALDAGFEGFLRKPLTGEMLADVIAQSWRPARAVPAHGPAG